MRRLARGEKIYPGVGGEGPVVVLTGAVHTGEGLFVKETREAVFGRDLLHDLHGQLVVVGGDVGRAVDGRDLVLGGRHLVVLGLGQDAELPELLIQVLHICLDPRLYAAEIVVVELLALGRAGAEEGAAGADQVAALLEELLIDEEVLLLGADGGVHAPDVLVAEELEHAQGLTGERGHGAQERGLFVQGLAAVGAEGRGDAERVALDEGVAGGVPGGVAAGLKGGAQAAGGEARCVRLALNELAAGELHYDAAVGCGAYKAVVLLGGNTGHGLEPVRKVRGSVLNGPVLHRRGDLARDVGIERLPGLYGLPQRIIDPTGETGLHDPVVKNHTSKILGYCRHDDHLFKKIKRQGRRRLCCLRRPCRTTRTL